MSTGRFERSSGDDPTGTCDTDKRYHIGNIIRLIASLLSSFIPSPFCRFGFACLCFFPFDLMFSAETPFRQQPTSAHCGGNCTILLLLCWVRAEKKTFYIKKWQQQQTIWRWDKALDVQLIVGNLIIEYRYIRITGNRFPASQQGGVFCFHPRISNVCLTITGIT